MKQIRIPYQFNPREYQRPVFEALDSGYRRAVLIWHRRAGKDKTLINLLTKKAFERRGTYFYFFPELKQGRKIIWDGMDGAGFPFIKHIPDEVVTGRNSQDMKLSLVNGSIIQIVGSDNIDSIVGTNPVGCVFSEYAIQDPKGWEFVRPILRENGGWAVFNYTPRGKNWGWDLYNTALQNPNEWFTQLLTYKDTGVLTQEDIEQERREGMSEELIAQEYKCSFEASMHGAYYAEQLRLAREQGRIASVPHVQGVRVDTWWDLGMNDSTAIWFTQDVGREIHVIDYYENSGEGLPHYVNVIRERTKELKYLYGRHVLPHDVKVRELGTGKSRQEILRELGLYADVAPKLRVEDGIEAARNIFSVCWFDYERCKRGIEALDHYRKEYDELNKIFKSRPVHDWSSHGADSWRTFATAHTFGHGSNRAAKTIVHRSSVGWT